jgi:hypothetical protein
LGKETEVKEKGDVPLDEVPPLRPLNRTRRREPRLGEELSNEFCNDERFRDTFDVGVGVGTDLKAGDLWEGEEVS